MTTPSSDLIETLYSASLEPNSFIDLVQVWDQQVSHSTQPLETALGLLNEESLQGHLTRATQIADRFEEQPTNQFDQLLAEFHTAAMILAPPNLVINANATAAALFQITTQQPLTALQLDGDDDQTYTYLIDVIQAMASEKNPQDRIIRCRITGDDRLMLMHLRPIHQTTRNTQPRKILVVTSEYTWSMAMTATLQRNFGITSAEIQVLRHLASGQKVATIATSTGKSEGTVRSQLNSLMEKTGIRSQSDLLRLVSLLLQSTSANLPIPQPLQPSALTTENVFQHIVLPDGRKLDYMSIGDPQGKPFLWLMSLIGLARWHRDAEQALEEKGLRMIVPVRAGFGFSSPPPPRQPLLEVAVADTFHLLDQLGIACCPVVAPADDFRLALMMAQQHPDRISHIFTGGAGFPLTTPDQHRRLHSISRFFRANARYALVAIPLLIKAVRALIRHQGVANYIRQSLSRSPVDQKIFADPAVSSAIVAGFQLLAGQGTNCDQFYGREIIEFHAPWPTGLGQVACPVTLFHGVHDHNSSIETAREYAALYPKWEFLIYPDEGQLILYSQWPQILARLQKNLESLAS